MSRHLEVDDLLGAYALGAVSPREATTVREHVTSCLDCSSTLRRLAAVAAVLPLAVDEVTPPASLRGRLMAEVDGEGGSRVGELRSPVGRGGITGRLGNFRLPALVSQPRRWLPGAMAAALIAGLLSWNLALQQELHSSGHAPGVSTVATGALTDARNARRGTITSVARGQAALVSLHSLPTPAAGRVYELWLIPAGGLPQPAGLFTPEANGTKLLLVPHRVGPKDIIAITEEPEPGSAAPTSAPMITGHI
jgi:anti-sigma-K factor RskA